MDRNPDCDIPQTVLWGSNSSPGLYVALMEVGEFEKAYVFHCANYDEHSIIVKAHCECVPLCAFHRW
jgi:hypothetical protein